MYPFVNPIAQELVRPFRCLRHRSFVANNETVRGLVQVGTFSGSLVEKIAQVTGTAGGAQLEDVTNEIFFDRQARVLDEGDELLDPLQQLRFRVLRVFRYPIHTVVWVARSTTTGSAS